MKRSYIEYCMDERERLRYLWLNVWELLRGLPIWLSKDGTMYCFVRSFRIGREGYMADYAPP